MYGNQECKCPLCKQGFTPKSGLTADETLAKGVLTVYKEMQNKETSSESGGQSLPCPRCGNRKAGDSVLSRHEDVCVCLNCTKAELIAEASGETPLPLMEWYAVSSLLARLNDNGERRQ